MTDATRTILLNPGPVTLSKRVRNALAGGDWCHREPEFAALVRDINARLANTHPSIGPGFDAVTLAASGTGAVEAMLATFAPDERTTLVVANGVYGERMARMLAALGKPHTLADHAWTAPIDIEALHRRLEGSREITHLAVVHHETTTGRLNDLDAVGGLCRRHGVTMLLDAVSSFGAERIEGPEWNLGALAGTANKCLHGVPGLSFVLAGRPLWEAAPCRPRGVYLDLRGYHASQHRDGFSPFTLPVQVAFALREALREHEEQGGSGARRATYLARARRIHAVLARLGVQTLLDPADYSAVLWSWRLPEGRTYAELHDRLKSLGFVIYAGQGDLGARIFRIAHMGDIGEDDLARLESALEQTLGPAR